jgi:hypothetical protein
MWAEKKNFGEIFLTLFFFVLNSFQGGIKFSELPALQWTFPPLICGVPAAMGVVVAIEFFWSNMANPAIKA